MRVSLEDIEHQDVLDEALRDVIRPATLITGLIYAGIGAGHWFALSGIAGSVVSAVDWGLARFFSRFRMCRENVTSITVKFSFAP